MTRAFYGPGSTGDDRIRADLTIAADFLADDAIRIEIDCKHSTTGVTSVPGGAFEMTREQLITAATFEHEQRYGSCDTSEAHHRGDQVVRAATDRVWNDVQAAVMRQRVQDRRN